MEHVRLDDRAHREIHRVLKPEGIYLFTVPHSRERKNTVTRVEVKDAADPAQDVHLLVPEYHGDANSKNKTGALTYRSYGSGLDLLLNDIGFEVEYCKQDIPEHGILNTELFYCRKKRKPL